MANTQQYGDDVSAIDITQFGGATQSAVDVAAAIDAIQDALASVGGDSLRVTAPSALPTDLTSQTGRNLGKARLMDSSEVLVDPAQNVDGASTSSSAAGTGQANAAQISVPDGCRTVTIGYETSGAATITVEVSPDGGTTWYPLTSFSPGSAATNADTVETGFDDVRAYIDANLTSLHIGAKGA